MVGILIVTHGDLGKALKSSSEFIMGEKQNIRSLGLYHGEDIEDLVERIKKEITYLTKEFDNNEVLVFVDMFGGSPSNATARAINDLGDKQKVECITGVNLPMLLEVASMSEFQDLSYLKELAITTGNNTVFCLKNKIGM